MVHQQRQEIMKPPRWRYCSSIYQAARHFTLYRDEHLGVQLQIMVKRNWWVFPPREKSFYFIDGINHTFTVESKLMRALKVLNIRKKILQLRTSRKDRAQVTGGSGKVHARAATG